MNWNPNQYPNQYPQQQAPTYDPYGFAAGAQNAEFQDRRPWIPNGFSGLVRIDLMRAGGNGRDQNGMPIMSEAGPGFYIDVTAQDGTPYSAAIRGFGKPKTHHLALGDLKQFLTVAYRLPKDTQEAVQAIAQGFASAGLQLHPGQDAFLELARHTCEGRFPIAGRTALVQTKLWTNKTDPTKTKTLVMWSVPQGG